MVNNQLGWSFPRTPRWDGGPHAIVIVVVLVAFAVGGGGVVCDDGDAKASPSSSRSSLPFLISLLLFVPPPSSCLFFPSHRKESHTKTEGIKLLKYLEQGMKEVLVYRRIRGISITWHKQYYAKGVHRPWSHSYFDSYSCAKTSPEHNVHLPMCKTIPPICGSSLERLGFKRYHRQPDITTLLCFCWCFFFSA